MEDAIYSKGSALIIGINEYEAAYKLSKAANDANAIADALSKLSFYVDLHIDADIDICDSAVENFISSLDKFDVGVFYFAGHGIEIDGENYILVKNTPVENKNGVTRYSINLQNIVKKMHRTKCNTNILIIDALMGHNKRELLKSAFSFIRTILLPFSNRLLFYPSEYPTSTSINIFAKIAKTKELWSNREVDRYYIDAIMFNDVDLLNDDGTDGMELFTPTTYNSVGELTKKICEIYTIPQKYFTVTNNIAFENREIYINRKFRYL